MQSNNEVQRDALNIAGLSVALSDICSSSLFYIFRMRPSRIDNRKKSSLSSNISSRCPHNVLNFSSLAAEIGLPVWGTPANSNGFRILAALLHGSQLVGVSQTLRR